jgi:hypothetical protein
MVAQRHPIQVSGHERLPRPVPPMAVFRLRELLILLRLHGRYYLMGRGFTHAGR